MFTFFLLRHVIKWAIRLFLAFITISLLWVVAYRFINPPSTALMNSRGNTYNIDAQHTWVDYDNIGNNIKMAVICGEDQRFKDHMGFDFKAIQKAIQHNMGGGKIRGASTISQQTAKNVFLWEGRSWIRKGLEVWFTLLIELLWNKERILEVYLNIIELGPGEELLTKAQAMREAGIESPKAQIAPIFGVEAAAQFYFNTSSNNLTKTQAAKLASILPCPSSCGMNSAFAYKHRLFILRCMRKWGKKLLL
ncbi:MAG: monofunctional biosynthetic peptidoglycan transglycosylase [Bacteroidota bacterium]|jgi:monofunctional biosynthetic peptidoglycan transglycosylase